MKTNKKEYIIVESPKGVFKIKVVEYKPVKTLGIIVGLDKKESYIGRYSIFLNYEDELFDSKQDAVKHIDELVFHKEYRYEDLKAGLSIVIDGRDKEPEMIELEDGTKFEVKSADTFKDVSNKTIKALKDEMHKADEELKKQAHGVLEEEFDYIKNNIPSSRFWIDEVTEITEDMQKAIRGRHQRDFKLRSVPFKKLKDENITIGEKIKAFRKEAGLSKKELAEKIDFNSSSISFIEKNKQSVTIKTLKELTEVFNCYASDILMF